jgi:uncharacterized Zn finger protein
MSRRRGGNVPNRFAISFQGAAAMPYGWSWKPYVSVAQRQAKAKRYATKLAKKGRQILPVDIAGRKIATTFWGTAWCENLESYSDFANRLPRGRTYVRNGSVIDLQIERGCVTALVSGSEIYEIKIDVSPVDKTSWKNIKQDCSRAIDSLIDLLQGRFAKGVMERLTRQQGGLFPKPKEISVQCSCPDWAALCKHAAAALYGVGARLDGAPEMLFLLRGVDHLDLISQAVDGANLDAALASGEKGKLVGEDLGKLFGIEMETRGDEESQAKRPAAPRVRRPKTARSKAAVTKPSNHAKRTTRSAGQCKETASVGAKRSAKKKAAGLKTAAAKSTRHQKDNKPKSRKKK